MLARYFRISSSESVKFIVLKSHSLIALDYLFEGNLLLFHFIYDRYYLLDGEMYSAITLNANRHAKTCPSTVASNFLHSILFGSVGFYFFFHIKIEPEIKSKPLRINYRTLSKYLHKWNLNPFTTKRAWILTHAGKIAYCYSITAKKKSWIATI